MKAMDRAWSEMHEALRMSSEATKRNRTKVHRQPPALLLQMRQRMKDMTHALRTEAPEMIERIGKILKSERTVPAAVPPILVEPPLGNGGEVEREAQERIDEAKPEHKALLNASAHIQRCGPLCGTLIGLEIVSMLLAGITATPPGHVLCDMVGIIFAVMSGLTLTLEQRVHSGQQQITPGAAHLIINQLASTIGYGMGAPIVNGLKVWHGLTGWIMQMVYYPWLMDFMSGWVGLVDAMLVAINRALDHFSEGGFRFLRVWRKLVSLLAGVSLWLGHFANDQTWKGAKEKWYNAFYLILMTASTVGYGDLAPTTETGQWLSMLTLPWLNTVYGHLSESIGGDFSSVESQEWTSHPGQVFVKLFKKVGESYKDRVLCPQDVWKAPMGLNFVFKFQIATDEGAKCAPLDNDQKRREAAVDFAESAAGILTDGSLTLVSNPDSNPCVYEFMIPKVVSHLGEAELKSAFFGDKACYGTEGPSKDPKKPKDPCAFTLKEDAADYLNEEFKNVFGKEPHFDAKKVSIVMGACDKDDGECPQVSLKRRGFVQSAKEAVMVHKREVPTPAPPFTQPPADVPPVVHQEERDVSQQQEDSGMRPDGDLSVIHEADSSQEQSFSQSLQEEDLDSSEMRATEDSDRPSLADRLRSHNRLISQEDEVVDSQSRRSADSGHI